MAYYYRFENSLSVARFLNSRFVLIQDQQKPFLSSTKLWQLPDNNHHQEDLILELPENWLKDQIEQLDFVATLCGGEQVGFARDLNWIELEWEQFALQVRAEKLDTSIASAFSSGLLFRIRGSQGDLKQACDLLLSYHPGVENQLVWFYNLGKRDSEKLDVLLWVNPFRAGFQLRQLSSECVKYYVPYIAGWFDDENESLNQNRPLDGFAHGLFIEHGLKLPHCYGLARIFSDLGNQRQQLVLRSEDANWNASVRIHSENVQGLYDVTHFTLSPRRDNQPVISATVNERAPKSIFETRLKVKRLPYSEGGLETRINSLYATLADMAMEISQLEEMQEQVQLEERQIWAEQKVEQEQYSIEEYSPQRERLWQEDAQGKSQSQKNQGLSRLYVFLEQEASDGSFIGNSESHKLRQVCLQQPYCVLKQCEYASYTVKLKRASDLERDSGGSTKVSVHLVRARSDASIQAAQTFLEALGGDSTHHLFLSSPRWHKYANLDIFLHATGGRLQHDLQPFLYPITNNIGRIQKRVDTAQRNLEKEDRLEIETTAHFLAELSHGYVNESFKDAVTKIDALDPTKFDPAKQKVIIFEPEFLEKAPANPYSLDMIALLINDSDFKPLHEVVRESLTLNNCISGAQLEGLLQEKMKRTIDESISVNFLKPISTHLVKTATDNARALVENQAKLSFDNLNQEFQALQKEYQDGKTVIDNGRSRYKQQIKLAEQKIGQLRIVAQAMQNLAETIQKNCHRAIEAFLIEYQKLVSPRERRYKKYLSGFKKLERSAQTLTVAERRKAIRRFDQLHASLAQIETRLKDQREERLKSFVQETQGFIETLIREVYD